MADKKLAPKPTTKEPEDFDKAYGDFYKQQTAENEATSKAVGDFVKSIPRKVSDMFISKAYKKGGTASSRADGIAIRGKTRGTISSMCCGGKTKK